jgi:rubrerythrin
MTHHEIASDLAQLVQLDIDAVLAYDRALDGIDVPHLAATLASFKLDHQRHVLELSQLMLGMGATPPQAKPDMKGTLLGSVTGLRARFGTEQAIRAMVPNEELTTTTYARTLAKPFPADVLEIVRRNAADEQRHLSWLERAIDERAWERPDTGIGAGAP